MQKFVFAGSARSLHFCTVNKEQRRRKTKQRANIDHRNYKLFMRLYTGNPNAAQTSAAFFLCLCEPNMQFFVSWWPVLN
jgi:hypothetical protein